MLNTCDLYDKYLNTLQVCTSPLVNYGFRAQCHGEIVTVQCYQDNSLVKEILTNTSGTGKVLVVDGGGNTDYALLGDLIAAAAAKTQWQGIIINGALRDIGALAEIDIHIKALGNIPRKTERKGQGIADHPVYFGAVTFTSGHWLYSDNEGLVVSQFALEL